MIGRLQGVLLSKQPPQLLIDVNGVGYEVDAPMSTFYQLPDTGETVVLHTHLVVREDAQLLYGFYAEKERHLFRSLIKINGVGPKLALTILSGISFDEFATYVMEDNAKALTALPGVGKKTAERLIIELRDKIGKDFAAVLPVKSNATKLINDVADPVSDAVSALVALGYKAQEASRMVRNIESEGLATEEIIRLSLQGVMR